MFVPFALPISLYKTPPCASSVAILSLPRGALHSRCGPRQGQSLPPMGACPQFLGGLRDPPALSPSSDKAAPSNPGACEPPPNPSGSASGIVDPPPETATRNSSFSGGGFPDFLRSFTRATAAAHGPLIRKDRAKLMLPPEDEDDKSETPKGTKRYTIQDPVSIYKQEYVRIKAKRPLGASSRHTQSSRRQSQNPGADRAQRRTKILSRREATMYQDISKVYRDGQGEEEAREPVLQEAARAPDGRSGTRSIGST